MSESLQILQQQLSPQASISKSTDPLFNTQRWSECNSATPGAIVNVASEDDISNTVSVKWANTNNIPFLAQSGGHGLYKGLSTLGANGILINLRALNTVKVDATAGTATIGGGTLTHEAIDAAQAAGTHIVTGVCNTVGVVGALVGGGLGYLLSVYGMGLDNMISCRLVTATGEVIEVSAESNEELWWGIRGAGHNFGIVSQLVVKAHPWINRGVHWKGMLGFAGGESDVERVVTAIQEMGVGKNMGLSILIARLPPMMGPMLVVFPYYVGPEAEAKVAYAKLLELNPMINRCGEIPYDKVNKGHDPACLKGRRKPTFGIAVRTLDVEKMKAAWREWEAFTTANPEAMGSTIIVECFDTRKTREIDPMETAYSWREEDFHMLFVPMHTDPGFDTTALSFGRKLRDSFKTEGKAAVYVNFAHGDEDLGEIYGSEERLAKLRDLKKTWDPEGRFSFYNPIPV
ncbi:hypothetical protein BJ875DRAFT_380380 [Amylocarpus encephaloides]|uniref:FAD-binding PCMH-type domain-containing protein n=1 Tax=Amylocarpus encephaloides TaxID=45428 RepID=A0A9P8C3K2_9HELO|nr:hypothetical protein BJ875DRAFT_380380 [Amylocarpus encephaloides]